MCFFDLVEQHDRIRPATDFLSELTAFLKADVARRSADQSADIVLLHVFAHVDLDERFGVAKHELRKGLGEQRFANAGGPGKDEAASRPLRILEP